MTKKIELLDGKPLEIASHAALKCYQAESPVFGKLIDVEGRLFDTSHHTTLQHAQSFFTFSLEGIAVGDVTEGLHLTFPFYNSDQRSGRYCAKMFLEPDFEAIETYIATYWPQVKKRELESVMEYVKKGVEIYHSHIGQATEIAKKFLQEERPRLLPEPLEIAAKKIAQEQMRMFISLIFPTGLDYTINLTTLAAIYRTAWTPAMRDFVSGMVGIVLEKHPELSFMFDPAKKSKDDWSIDLPDARKIHIAKSPSHRLVRQDGKFIVPKSYDMHPVDLLHFKPEYMDNSVSEIKTRIAISLATMGQDQRHRTIRRGRPIFTGKFYLPPILSKMKLDDEAKKYFAEWIKVGKRVPGTLAMVLAPYGAMVSYDKVGSLNAIAHEQGKRLCWCAQEEIYHAGLFLRQAIERKCGKNSNLLHIFEPPCYQTGICAEGARYCGRIVEERKTGNYFPRRKV